jgi:hypothetical protein
VPVLRRSEDRAPILGAARRFGVGTGAAFLVLIGSGSAMATHYHKWSDSTLQVKLGLVVLVFVLIGAHVRWSTSRLLDAVVFVVSLAIVWLGIVVAG